LAVPRSGPVVTAKPFDAHTTRVPDRSLDEFASASAGSDEAVDGDESIAGSSDADESGAGTDGDHSVPTMRWSADGAPCDACGATVERRWRDGDAVVCADCKEW
jgi:hypothetical protein